MPYLVLKPIPTNDRTIPSGEIVDAEDWRNLRTLISGRYLSAKPVDKPATKPAPVKEAAIVADAPAPAAATAPAKAAKAKRPATTSTPEE